MDKEDIEKMARRAGKSPRAFCLDEIEKWKKRLTLVSTDYRGLDRDEFEKRFEAELEEHQQD